MVVKRRDAVGLGLEYSAVEADGVRFWIATDRIDFVWPDWATVVATPSSSGTG